MAVMLFKCLVWLAVVTITVQLSAVTPDQFEKPADYQQYEQQTDALKNALAKHQERTGVALTPDYLFDNCCARQTQKMGSDCRKYCTYNKFSLNTLKEMAMNTNPKCGKESLGSYVFCAGAGVNHRANCMNNQVDKTSAGILCASLCDTRRDSVLTITREMLPCVQTLPLVRRSFENYLQDVINSIP